MRIGAYLRPRTTAAVRVREREAAQPVEMPAISGRILFRPCNCVCRPRPGSAALSIGILLREVQCHQVALWNAESPNLPRWRPRTDDLTQGDDLSEVIGVVNGQALESIDKRVPRTHFRHLRLR